MEKICKARILSNKMVNLDVQRRTPRVATDETLTVI